MSNRVNSLSLARRRLATRIGAPGFKLGLLLVLGLLCVALAKMAFTAVGDTRLLKTLHLNAPMTLAVLSQDGQFAASVDTSDRASGAYPISLWRTSDGARLYATKSYHVYSMRFSPDNRLLAAGGNDGIRLWQVSDGRLLRTLAGDQVFCLGFSPDGQTLASAGADGKVRIWRVADGLLLHAYDVNGWITSLSFSPDGGTLAAGGAAKTGLVAPNEVSSDDNPILLWRVSDNKQLPPLKGHQYGVLTLAFSPDGKTLASGGSDGLVQLWRVEDGQHLSSAKIDTKWYRSVRGNKTVVNSVSFRPDGRLLAIGSDNDTVSLLQVSEGTLKSDLKGHTDSVLGVLFSQDNKTLISIGKDSTLRQWSVQDNRVR